MKDQQRQSIREEIGLYFDNNMTPDAQESFLSKVNANPNYRSTFDREKNVRELLRNKVQRTSVSADLIQAIKNRIKKD
jgi:hypothetical protein